MDLERLKLAKSAKPKKSRDKVIVVFYFLLLQQQKNGNYPHKINRRKAIY